MKRRRGFAWPPGGAPAVAADLVALHQIFTRIEAVSPASKFRPKKFTEAQLATLVLLVDWQSFESSAKSAAEQAAKHPEMWAPVTVPPSIKGFGHLSYRDVITLVNGSPEIREALRLRRAPNYTTLWHHKQQARHQVFFYVAHLRRYQLIE